MSIAGFLLVALVFLAAVSVCWFSVRIGISPMPSSARARRAIVEAAAIARGDTIVELGSGWGTVAIALARQCPQRHVIGYELSLVPWLVSVLLKRLLRLQNLTLVRADFRTATFPREAVLVCYLFRRGMRELAQRLAREETPPAWLISNTFALPSWKPDSVIRLRDLFRTRIYLYRRPCAPLVLSSPA